MVLSLGQPPRTLVSSRKQSREVYFKYRSMYVLSGRHPVHILCRLNDTHTFFPKNNQRLGYLKERFACLPSEKKQLFLFE